LIDNIKVSIFEPSQTPCKIKTRKIRNDEKKEKGRKRRLKR
jgi:hypothetical protein